MTFSNMLFEMHSKISLPAFILMGTFSYLNAMNQDLATPVKNHSITEFSAGSSSLENFNSSTQTPEFGFDSIYKPSFVLKGESPGYVTPELNPLLHAYQGNLEEEVVSTDDFTNQSNELTLVSGVSTRNSTGNMVAKQRLDFGADVPQELEHLQKKNEELASLIQKLLSEGLDPSVVNDIDITQINRNLDYSKSYKDYIEASSSDEKEYLVAELMNDPDYKDLTIENAESYLRNKMLEGVPQVEQFFRELRKIQKTAAQNARQKHESCQQLAAYASNMLVTTSSVVNDMDARNSSLWTSLTGLVYNQEVLKYMKGKLEISRDLVDSRNSSALINAFEVLTAEFVKASAMNLNLTESQLLLTKTVQEGQLTLDKMLKNIEQERLGFTEERKMQNKTIASLTRICEDHVQTIKDYFHTITILTLEVNSLKSTNQSLILKQESDEREKTILQSRIQELEKQLAQKSTFGAEKN